MSGRSEWPVPPVTPEDVPTGDRTAEQEERLLRTRERESTFRRQESLRDRVNVVALVLLSFAAGILIVVVLIVLWHYFAPADWHWLTNEQLARVETVTSTQAFAAVLGGIGTALLGQLRKQLQ